VKIKINQTEDIYILTLQGNLCSFQASTFEQTVLGILNSGIKDPWFPCQPPKRPPEHIHMIFDFSEVPLMDSTGLGALIRSYQMVVRKGGFVFIAGLRDEPYMVLEISQTIRLFQTFESPVSAVSSMKQILKSQQQLAGWIGA